ncbi:hypothetical protein MHBO_004415, partial [Bonamia ostreae]
ISSNSVSVERGKSNVTDLTLTVPFPCPFHTYQSRDPENCQLRIEMIVPTGNSKTCSAQLASDSGCGIKVYRHEWNNTKSFTIIHKDSGKYIVEREKKLFLKTYEIKWSKMWSFNTLPVINVCILFDSFTNIKQ